MKSPDSPYWLLVFTSLTILIIIGLAINLRLSEAAYFDCCPPPVSHPSAARFQQNAQVTVYIPDNSGLTTDEIAAIEGAIEDWNDEVNTSGVQYNVVQANPPGQQINNTIVVNFTNTPSQNTGGGSLTMMDQRTGQGEVTKTWGVFTVWTNHRTLEPPSNRMVQLRNTARHEAGHGLGLANAENCPPGSTIMNPSWTEETFITECDNDKINTDPVYPSPTPTPEPSATPTPELCRLEGMPCNYGDVCCNEQENWCNGFTGVCTDCPGQLVDGICTPTPIVIDVLGNGFKLTNLAGGVHFDLDLDGVAEPLAWTSAGSDDAFLVLDRDGNATIDNGTELFGDITPQPQPPPGENKNGFLALAVFDNTSAGGNGDGVISDDDSVFLALRLWQDTNHNGVSEQSELHELQNLGLAIIELHYKESKRTDKYGNKFKYRARVKDDKNAQMGRWAWDVIFVAVR